VAKYAAITGVTPLASMVTGFPVTAALGDQIRDDLVALNDGWWFRASRSTSFVSAAAVASPLGLDTLTLSQTAEDEGTISLVSNAVQVNKTGLWLVGAHYTFAASSITSLVAVSYTDGISGKWAFESVNESSTATQTDVCGSGVAEVTSGTAVFTMYYYTSGSVTVATSTRSSVMWGVWMGATP
jgi:hypothetical protein